MGSLRRQLSSRSLSTVVKPANLLVFRSTSLVCLVIILVHLTVVYLLSDHLGRSPVGRRTQQRHLPGINDAEEPGVVAVVHPAAMRVAPGKSTDGEDGRMVWRERGLGAEDDAPSELRKNTNASVDRFFSQSACRNGHIQGFHGFCDPLSSCLRQLRVGNRGGGGSNRASDALRPDSLPTATRRKIQSMTGNLDPVHFSIVPLLTDIQWTSGIYGSVGEIGVDTGKFTVVLAYNVDPETGEGFLVSDNFDVPPPPPLPAGLTKYQVFSVYMRDTGFGEEFSGLRKLYVHRGDPTGLSKKLMHDWNLPQFRMISIDGAMGSGTLTALEWAACVLRDGGILIVDGIDEEKTRSQARFVLGQFFRKHGYSAFGPFLAAANKLYMCTTNWKQQYIESVVEKGSFLSLRHVNDDVWGSTMTYIRIT